MDANLQKLLDELPEKSPRSRLEPYREFIEQLRNKGRTYRNIAEILAEKCSVQGVLSAKLRNLLGSLLFTGWLTLRNSLSHL